ncbi:MAG: hypothetical protein ABSG01_16325 [Anaerolineales bacterium]
MNNKWIDQFSLWLDQLLVRAPGQGFIAFEHPNAQGVLQVAVALHEMDFEAELTPRAGLRARWERHFQPKNLDQCPLRRLVTTRVIWVAALILALALIVAFRQPVLAAVSRLFGYIYVQDSGFLPSDSTQVIQQPVMQEHDGSTLTVTRGVSTPDGITLYIETSDTASPVDGALLETEGGLQLALTYWEYFPNTSSSHGVKLTFPILPAGVTQTTLVLPAGWHLPLEWIPAAQSQLPDVQAVPYVDATQQPSPVADLCVEKNGINLCLQAAISRLENTSVLLKAQPINPALIPSSGMGLVWQSETEPVTLRDEQGNIYPMDNQRPSFDGTLTFPPISGTHTLTLTVPAVFATVDIPDQVITVDVGSGPQPDTVIPLDVNIQVLDTTVHFSKATFVGDGVSSLRLTLNADEPIQTVHGITPDQLELGRPDRVDDLYGGGNFAGSKDIFVELIRGTGKITGVLNLPVISATVIVHGPFEFTFSLSDTAVITPTPLVANPGNFSPAATPTPMSLESYFYSGQTLQAGDLLYAAWNGSQSDIYRYNPAGGSAPELFMTLPGQVFSIYPHADHQGLDYLTGTFNQDMVVENSALYTLHFGDPLPRLLHTSPQGILTSPTWSPDGRLLAFNFQSPDPGEIFPRIGWIDMNCRSSGECPVQILDAPDEYMLSGPQFSPQGYWLAINGVDTTYGAGEIYLVQIDNHAQPGELQNFTHTDQIYDSNPGWIAGNKLVWNCTDPNAGDPNKDIPNICLQDILSGSSIPQKIYTSNDINFSFGLSSQGNYFWQISYIRSDQGAYQIWLHDLKSTSRLLIDAPYFAINPIFSMDESLLAYFSTTDYDKKVPETLHIAETATGHELAIFENINPVGWLGWVP